MNYCLAQIIQFAGITDGEDTFWIQILVLVVLGGVVGFGSLIKTRAKRFKTQEQYQPEGAGRSHSQRGRPIKAAKELKDKYRGIFLKTAQPKTITEGPTFNFEASDAASEGKQRNEIGKGRERDVDGGMEMLEPAFLLGVVENTKGDDKNNVMIRNLSFNELLRREQLAAVDSKALNIYAINEGNLYNKDIQCCAMKELAERTKVRL